MPHDFFERVRKHPAVLWVFIPLVALNIWFDYYHPFGIVLDVVIVLALFVYYGRTLSLINPALFCEVDAGLV
jgi:hypothetical protein